MLKKKRNKFEINFYDEDRRYALIIYAVFGIFTSFMTLFNNPYYTMVQGPFEPIYLTLTWMLIGVLVICFILCLVRKSMAELLVLIIGMVIMVFLLFEKTACFIIFPKELSPGTYVDYISMNVFKLIFLIYRFLKVNRVIKANKEYKEIVDDFTKEGK